MRCREGGYKKILNHMSISMRKFPRAIIHIDGDSFFVACELTKRPDLVGKPVVTGHERGIATAMSMEAKRLGVTRGMPVYQIKREFPSVVILPSDYESYALYSKRMIDIVRRYTSDVEEYSIDECFAEITGLQHTLDMSYHEIAKAIKKDLHSELGISFSVGLSVNKVLAKVASNYEKPNGLAMLPLCKTEEVLRDLPVGRIWGIGPNTGVYLEKLGINTALEFASKSFEFVGAYMTKPIIDIWHELHGDFVMALNTGKKTEYKSIMKTHTFTPPSSDPEIILSELSRNIESACARLRHHRLYTKDVIFYLKGQDFQHYGAEIGLSVPVCTPQKLVELVRENFGKVWKPGKLYRATGIILKKISSSDVVNPDLFGDFVNAEKVSRIYDEIDALAAKFGRPVVSLGSSISKGEISRIHKNRSQTRLLPLPLLGRVT